MKRLIACLVGCVLLAPASACGGAAAQSSGGRQSSVTVKPGPILETQGRKIYVFLLTPTGKPSGVVALKSVHDGRVQTIDHVRFTSMTDTGSAAVEVDGHRIVAFWTIPSKETASAQRSAVLPARSVSDMTAWAGLTATPSKTDAEQAFWTQRTPVCGAPRGGRDSGADQSHQRRAASRARSSPSRMRPSPNSKSAPSS